MDNNLSGLDVPPDSARSNSNAPSCDFSFSYSFSRVSLRTLKSPVLLGKVIFCFPRPASPNSERLSILGVMF